MYVNFSKLGSLKLSDWWRGLIVAVMTLPLSIIYDSLMATPVSFIFDWRAIVRAAILGGIAYISKNLGTGSGGLILTNEPPKIKIPDVK